jgi:4-hydroxy-tetrahydrodipicolinate synthase
VLQMDGVWLPLVTPFRDGAVDLVSYARMCEAYADTGIRGLILLGTTGEAPTVTPAERAALVRQTRETLSTTLPVLLGASGNATAGVVETMAQVDQLDVDGYLVASPYYNRPPQDGILAHFQQVCAATSRPVTLYNVPHRTGSNVSNDTVLQIAQTCPNLMAVKDTCGDLAQSFDLIRRAPTSLAVLTGDDAQFLSTAAAGGAGGVLAAAHLATAEFVRFNDLMRDQQLDDARRLWLDELAPLVPPLFDEPNPMPLKHVLWQAGLIASAECRLPLTKVSPPTATRLNAIASRVPAAPDLAGRNLRAP